MDTGTGLLFRRRFTRLRDFGWLGESRQHIVRPVLRETIATVMAADERVVVHEDGDGSRHQVTNQEAILALVGTAELLALATVYDAGTVLEDGFRPLLAGLAETFTSLTVLLTTGGAELHELGIEGRGLGETLTLVGHVDLVKHLCCCGKVRSDAIESYACRKKSSNCVLLLC